MAAPVVAATDTVVEIGPRAEGLTDPRLTRRLITLELTDVEVPPAEEAETDGRALFFRVLVAGSDSLRVELWELGQMHGARRISSHGTPQLRARRIALAAAELARQLAQKRRLAALRARPRELEEGPTEGVGTGLPLWARFTLSGGVAGARLGSGDAWVAGPALGAALQFESGPKLELGGSWAAGAAPESTAAGSLRWFEVSLAPSYVIPLGGGWSTEAGVVAAAASVRVSGSDGDAGPRDDWSARGGVRVRVHARLGRTLAIGFGPDVGAVLRPVPLPSGDGRQGSLGGAWLGAGVALVVDPLAPE